MKIVRLPNNPIIKPKMDRRMGDNINGPSLIRVPEWINKPLGKYYLYFAHHNGLYIRLAYADYIEGPWKTYEPGTLQLEESYFTGHIASPDVHVDYERQEIRMYYHGAPLPEPPGQFTRVAVSKDGIKFTAAPEVLGTFYWRVFRWKDYFYALAMSGMIYRSKGGLTDFEQGPILFKDQNLRHSAVKLDGNTLYVFYTRKGDTPERIMVCSVELTDDWHEWRESAGETILEPEVDYEGVNLPLEASKLGPVYEPVRQLRDPAIFEEDGKRYLLYSVAGESGIAISEIV